MEELRFTYTVNDLVMASRLDFRRSVRCRVMLAYALLVCVFGAWLASKGYGQQDSFPAAAGVAFLLFGLFFIPAYNYGLIPYYARRQFRLTPPLQKEVVVRFNDQELEMDNTAGKARNKWFLKTVCGADAILLYINTRAYYIFPRRVFENDMQYERLNRLGLKLSSKEASESAEST